MIKFLIGIFISAVCLGIALIPPGIMWFLWHLVQPTDQFAKIIMVALFVVGGGSISVIFAIIGFMLWAAFMSILLETRF